MQKNDQVLWVHCLDCDETNTEMDFLSRGNKCPACGNPDPKSTVFVQSSELRHGWLKDGFNLTRGINHE